MTELDLIIAQLTKSIMKSLVEGNAPKLKEMFTVMNQQLLEEPGVVAESIFEIHNEYKQEKFYDTDLAVLLGIYAGLSFVQVSARRGEIMLQERSSQFLH